MLLLRPASRSAGIVGIMWACTIGWAALTPAGAANVALGKQVWETKIGCPSCHGWAGDGSPLDPRSASGPSLRATQLDRAGIIEVVRCGRIGTKMPHFEARAYEDDRCYGVTKADLEPEMIPPKSGASLIKREWEALADYLQAHVMGRGSPTREECFEYYGPNAPGCEKYPPAAGD